MNAEPIAYDKDEEQLFNLEAPEIKLNGDVKINNQSYDNHTHTGVTSGGSSTGPVT